MLFLHCSLLALQGSSEIVDTIGDLQECFKRMISSRKPIASNVSKASDGEEAPITVLTDILLSLLAQPSHAVRDMVSTVFRYLAQFIPVQI